MAVRVRASLLVRDVSLIKFLMSNVIIRPGDPPEVVRIIARGKECWWPVVSDKVPDQFRRVKL